MCERSEVCTRCGGIRLPAVPHVPGRTPRPPEGYFTSLKSGLSSDLSVGELAASPAFVGALAAFTRGYYWEAHELFEAVWLCLPPACAERCLLQGLIQLANAGLKRSMGLPRAVKRLRGLADGALSEAQHRSRAPQVMGLGQEEVAQLRAQVERAPSALGHQSPCLRRRV